MSASGSSSSASSSAAAAAQPPAGGGEDRKRAPPPRKLLRLDPEAAANAAAVNKMSPRPLSPADRCAICLSEPENISYAYSCLHRYCFACLLEWSKRKPECPQCKRPFSSIIHNVRADDDYDEYAVPVNTAAAAAAAAMAAVASRMAFTPATAAAAAAAAAAARNNGGAGGGSSSGAGDGGDHGPHFGAGSAFGYQHLFGGPRHHRQQRAGLEEMRIDLTGAAEAGDAGGRHAAYHRHHVGFLQIPPQLPPHPPAAHHRWQQFRYQMRVRGDQPGSAAAASSDAAAAVPESAEEIRRNRRLLYQRRMYPVASATQPDGDIVRDVSPSFDTCETQRHRLVPFLLRELSCAGCPDPMVAQRIVHHILRLVRHHRIDSAVFQRIMTAYLGGKGRHFCDELLAFARSRHETIAQYDQAVVYAVREAPSPPPAPLTDADADSLSEELRRVARNQRPGPTPLEPDDAEPQLPPQHHHNYHFLQYQPQTVTLQPPHQQHYRQQFQLPRVSYQPHHPQQPQQQQQQRQSSSSWRGLFDLYAYSPQYQQPQPQHQQFPLPPSPPPLPPQSVGPAPAADDEADDYLLNGIIRHLRPQSPWPAAVSGRRSHRQPQHPAPPLGPPPANLLDDSGAAAWPYGEVHFFDANSWTYGNPQPDQRLPESTNDGKGVQNDAASADSGRPAADAPQVIVEMISDDDNVPTSVANATGELTISDSVRAASLSTSAAVSDSDSSETGSSDGEERDRDGGEDAAADADGPASDSDSCVIVGYERPWEERTPISPRPPPMRKTPLTRQTPASGSSPSVGASWLRRRCCPEMLSIEGDGQTAGPSTSGFGDFVEDNQPTDGNASTRPKPSTSGFVRRRRRRQWEPPSPPREDSEDSADSDVVVVSVGWATPPPVGLSGGLSPAATAAATAADFRRRARQFENRCRQLRRRDQRRALRRHRQAEMSSASSSAATSSASDIVSNAATAGDSSVAAEPAESTLVLDDGSLLLSDLLETAAMAAAQEYRE
ncbi:hypothetical protein BOX15_Mlig008553g15 [Macrostomum lignano]|uniref:E3 ubiquitin-protein ligase Topors n=1 Tax=Macrostomum lignano TaxID=282301 RepID=A0A267FKJ7_9PLAT|nr:hypothetical protein BOX15_Mlig008553g15 [Macrostomum lignano]